MARISVVCPNLPCRARLQIDESLLGRTGRCPGCKATFVLARSEGVTDPGIWAIGRVLLDDFEVERPLGQGGMGTVYLVRSRSGGQRFAVKTVREDLLGDADSRRNFLDELQTWIDLPEHPHLAACRFFRTVDDQVAIFAEYVDGGSLADAIEGRRFTRLDQILDVAIQLAWGLHAAHVLGLVHQDVKPGNVLMTDQGLAKVSDFGLARARVTADERIGDAAGRSALVSWGGMTVAYCSPEQSKIYELMRAGVPRQDWPKLTRQTDIWSWGVSVLEMFTGEVTWRSGQVAAEALEDYMADGPSGSRQTAMPLKLAEVLRRCFQYDPVERWANLAEAAEHLVRAYCEATDCDYPRQPPAIPDSIKHRHDTHDRLVMGVRWTDPRKWLREAGLTPEEAQSPIRPGSRRANAIADLAICEQAVTLIARRVEGGDRDSEPKLASLYREKAMVHFYLDDTPGACLANDCSLAIYERLVEKEGRRELLGELALTCLNKAVVLPEGEARAKAELYDRALRIYEDLVERQGLNQYIQNLARVCINKSHLMNSMHKLDDAASLADRAIEFYKGLIEREGRRDQEELLAAAYMTKSNAMNRGGDYQASLELCEKAIVIRERLVQHEGRRDLNGDLAAAYLNKAVAMNDLSKLDTASAVCDRAITLYESLVEGERRRELSEELGIAYLTKGNTTRLLEDYEDAVRWYQRATRLYDRLVVQEGRHDLSDSLAKACFSQGGAAQELGDTHAAGPLCDRAIAILDRLVLREGRQELASDLALAYLTKVRVAEAIGDHAAAEALYGRAITMYEQLVGREGRNELTYNLGNAYKGRAKVMDYLGDRRTAAALYDSAIAIYERISSEWGEDLKVGLDTPYAERAELAKELGDHRGALAACDGLIATYERAAELTNSWQVLDVLGTAYMSKADAMQALGEAKPAVAATYDRAIAIYDRLVEHDGRRELAEELASAIEGKVKAVVWSGDLDSVLAMFERIITIRERLVELEERRELADRLARNYLDRAFLSFRQRGGRAVASIAQARDYYERLVGQGRVEFRGDRAWAMVYLALALFDLGQAEEAIVEANIAMEILKEEAARTGRDDLRSILDLAISVFGSSR